MNPVDPAREKVERVDAVVREFQESVIDDPTVFVKGAALGGLTLIELAKLGQSKSQDLKIRSFGDGMRAGQEALRKELVTIAGRKRLDVPDSLIYPDEQMLQTAPEQPGAEFDTWFVSQAMTEIAKAVALFGAAVNMTDKELAAFAKRSLPKLESDRKSAGTLLGQ